MTASRLLSADVIHAPLDHSLYAVAEVRDGSPTTGAVALTALGDVEVGVWEMTTGVAQDTEVDEVFIVLAGHGEVTFEDGESIPLTPGVAVRLTAGERTTWTVTETLRKVYLAR